MTLRLRLRLVLTGLLGALLLVSTAAALQFRELAALTTGVLGPDARMLETTAEMQRLLGEPERGPDFVQAFGLLLEEVENLQVDERRASAVEGIKATFDAWQTEQHADNVDETALRSAIAALTSVAGDRASTTADVIRDEALTAALGLGILAALTLLFSAWAVRSAQAAVFDRLAAIDGAVAELVRGHRLRRISTRGNDELSRLADALNQVLDLRDQTEAAMEGRNRELRAVLVALLFRWPRPAAVTGVDGELMVSTLNDSQEAILRSITSQLRDAAGTLLSRHFSTASELETNIRIEDHVIEIKALAVDPKRVVGWLSTFSE